MERKEIELRQGTISYREAGSGPAVVFVHGFLVDGRLWDGVAERLSTSCRCIVPDWPFGSHRTPMQPDADLSPPGIAGLIRDFLEELELRDVTMVANDSGGAMTQVFVTTHPERVGRLVLTNCDTHENFPPGIFKAMPPLARLPGALFLMGLPTRLGPVRRAAFAPFAKSEIDPELVDAWVEPGSDARIRRDTGKVVRGMNKRYTLEAAERLRDFDRPALLSWAPEDRFFPITYAERLASQIPDARIEPIPDAKTFVALDQPARLAELIGEFIGAPAPTAA